MNYKTPGVYTEDVSLLPPSVASVATAIPAFIGYTAMAGKSVKKIATLRDYERNFGGAKSSTFTVQVEIDLNTKLPVIIGEPKPDAVVPDYLMYYAVQMYYLNGGGPCYIISVGEYSDAGASKDDFKWGMEQLAKEDEPTLILLTDAIALNSPDYYEICGDALKQCALLKDRFAIFDVPIADLASESMVTTDSPSVGNFRDEIGMNALQYSAAYYPYLKTSLNYAYTEDNVEIKTTNNTPSQNWILDKGGITVTYTGDGQPEVEIDAGDDQADVTFDVSGTKLTITNVEGKAAGDVITAWTNWSNANNNSFDLQAGSGDTVDTTNGASEPLQQASSDTTTTLNQDNINTANNPQNANTARYNLVRAKLTEARVVMPPSGAIAGVYVRVDGERGAWKAPANVSLAGVIEPTVKITNTIQDGLNIDPEAGKSVNAIRAFTGKGTLVWGARTLAGNDNEWRYINVRRLFNLIEESTQKSTQFAVFESNDATTWLKVKAMIESYLYDLWRQGALMGSTSEQAYFINVGLGKTMTQQDVLNGIMIVEIGIAAVRPAEFIILRFMHKLPE